MGAADHRVDLPVDPHPFPEIAFHRPHDAFRQGTMVASTFDAVEEMTTQTLFAVDLPIAAHMIGTHQLVVMGRIENFTTAPSLPLPLPDLQARV